MIKTLKHKIICKTATAKLKKKCKTSILTYCFTVKEMKVMFLENNGQLIAQKMCLESTRNYKNKF